jgi:hypothetical protein
MASIAPGAAFAQRTITIVIPEEPDSLDNCNSARSAVGRVIRQNVNETLIELDPNDSTLKPRLAMSWKQMDATTWRFNLRKGVKYSDGTPLTPEAIASSVDKALDPKLDCNARTKMFSGFKIRVVKVDDRCRHPAARSDSAGAHDNLDHRRPRRADQGHESLCRHRPLHDRPLHGQQRDRAQAQPALLGQEAAARWRPLRVAQGIRGGRRDGESR